MSESFLTNDDPPQLNTGLMATHLALLDPAKSPDVNQPVVGYISSLYHKTKHAPGARQQACDLLLQTGFVDKVADILIDAEKNGIWSSDPRWFCTYYCLNSLWNWGDISVELSNEVVRCSRLMDVCYTFLTSKKIISAMGTRNGMYVVKSTLSILGNCLRRPGNAAILDKKKWTDLCVSFTSIDGKTDFIEGISALCLAYLVDDNNAHVLDTTTDAIHFLVTCLANAVESDKGRSRGFTAGELVSGLAALAVNDSIKRKLQEVDVLPTLFKVLKQDDPEAKSGAVSCLWSLAFDESVRNAIINNYDGVTVLTKMMKSAKDPNLLRSLDGALWVLKSSAEKKAKKVSGEQSRARGKSVRGGASGKKPYVFLSYSWANQPAVLQLRKALGDSELDCWIDVEQMKGSTLEAMSQGIEKSSAVIICMSEDYKRSPNCRVEAEYAFTLQKPLFCCLMQESYRPEGWLGIILGAKLYYNMAKPTSFRETFDNLLKNVSESLFGDATALEAPVVLDANPAEAASAARKQSHALAGNDEASGTGNGAGHVGGASSASALAGLSKEDAAKWLKDHGLEKIASTNPEIDGAALAGLKHLLAAGSAEYVCEGAQRHMSVDFLTALRLISALKAA